MTGRHFSTDIAGCSFITERLAAGWKHRVCCRDADHVLRRLGEVPQDRPIHSQEVFATLYHQLGIDVRTATMPDHSGRPQYLLDHQSVVKELVYETASGWASALRGMPQQSGKRDILVKSITACAIAVRQQAKYTRRADALPLA